MCFERAAQIALRILCSAQIVRIQRLKIEEALTLLAKQLVLVHVHPYHRHHYIAVMAATNGDAAKITLYTNHRCPFAHRAHIVLKELGLKYEEVIIDLDKPREPRYLEINPVRVTMIYFMLWNLASCVPSFKNSDRDFPAT